MNSSGIPLLHSAVNIMTPLLLAATGGLFTELAGTLNIALEGLLLAGAFSAIVWTHYSGSLLTGVIAAVAAAMILAALQGAITIKLRANVFIAGLAVNLLAAGMTVTLSFKLFATRGVLVFSDMPRFKTILIPLLRNIPVIRDIVSGHTALVYCSWLILLLAWAALYRTPFGFRLRACEDHTEALNSLGIKSDTYRFASFLISGFACGFGGAFLSLNLGVFVPNMSSGKGWIALVVIFLGNRKPLGILFAALVFGLADSFSNYAQGALNVPADFILAIPYTLTLLAMIGVSIYTKRKNSVV